MAKDDDDGPEYPRPLPPITGPVSDRSRAPGESMEDYGKRLDPDGKLGAVFQALTDDWVDSIPLDKWATESGARARFREALNRPMWFDYDGQPITPREWEYIRRTRGVRVALTVLEPGAEPEHMHDVEEMPERSDDAVLVSTVWLGLDHGFGLSPPLIFESMIFGGQHDEWCDRYATLEEARAGHDVAVALAAEHMP